MRYYYYEGFAKYFDLPVLVLGIIASSAAVGLRPYLSSDIVAVINCMIGVAISIITSIKLYLNIESNMQNEASMSKKFQSLAMTIAPQLILKPEERDGEGTVFLNKCLVQYQKYIDESHLPRNKPHHRKLIVDDITNDNYSTSTSSDESLTPRSSTIPFSTWLTSIFFPMDPVTQNVVL